MKTKSFQTHDILSFWKTWRLSLQRKGKTPLLFEEIIVYFFVVMCF